MRLVLITRFTEATNTHCQWKLKRCCCLHTVTFHITTLFLGTAFYPGCCPEIGLGTAIVTPVHMGLGLWWSSDRSSRNSQQRYLEAAVFRWRSSVSAAAGGLVFINTWLLSVATVEGRADGTADVNSDCDADNSTSETDGEGGPSVSIWPQQQMYHSIGPIQVYLYVANMCVCVSECACVCVCVCCCFMHLEQSSTSRHVTTDFPKKRLKPFLFSHSFPF